MTRLSENSVLNIKNKSFSVTAEVVAPEKPLNGTIIAQGGAIGGWSLYTRDGHAKFAYNLLGIQAFTAGPPSRFRPASTSCAPSSPTTAAATPRAALSRCTTTARRSVRAAWERPSRSSSRPTRDWTSAARPGQRWPPSATWRAVFTGEINWVELKVGDDDHSHLIDPEEHLQVLMARQ